MEETFHAYFDGLDQAVILVSQDRVVRAVNPAYTRLTGLSPGETLGRRCPDVHLCQAYTLQGEAASCLREGEGEARCGKNLCESCPLVHSDCPDRSRLAWLRVSDRSIPILLSYSRIPDGLLVFFQSVESIHRYLHESRLELSRLGRELQLASGLEGAMVPYRTDHLPGMEIGQVTLCLRPVGGDMAESILYGGRWVSYVADLSGKSLPAALFLPAIRAACHDELGHPPAVALERLNRRLLTILPPSLFLCFTAVFGHGSELVVANAGNPAPWCSERGPLEDCLGMALGLEAAFSPRLVRVDLRPGEVLLLATDGLWESLERVGEGPHGLLQELASAPARGLQSALARSMGSRRRFDDLAATALRLEPKAPPVIARRGARGRVSPGLGLCRPAGTASAPRG